ncbi:MAG: DUF99 family protein [Thermoplasmata archaeon]|nr:DUF99 family protein [Thermoplasmata archaeon]
MRRALSKTHLRVAAVDDGAFSRRQKHAPLVAVVWSAPDAVEGVAIGRALVDGDDASDRIVDLVRSLPQFEGIRAVLLDGLTVGGFNVVDLGRVGRRLRRPVIAVTRRPPDFERIHRALRKYFPRDATTRWRRLRRHPLFAVPTGGRPILAAAVGCTQPEARALLHRVTRRGYWPEPLRLAHLIAHAVGAAARRPAPRSGRTLKRRSLVRDLGPVA